MVSYYWLQRTATRQALFWWIVWVGNTKWVRTARNQQVLTASGRTRKQNNKYWKEGRKKKKLWLVTCSSRYMSSPSSTFTAAAAGIRTSGDSTRGSGKLLKYLRSRSKVGAEKKTMQRSRAAKHVNAVNSVVVVVVVFSRGSRVFSARKPKVIRTRYYYLRRWATTTFTFFLIITLHPIY